MTGSCCTKHRAGFLVQDSTGAIMSDSSSEAVIGIMELGFQWSGLDPFIMTMHHLDDYPEGNEAQGPTAPLAGRRIGSDFSGTDGWSMYHG